jgi:hypothetical protein
VYNPSLEVSGTGNVALPTSNLAVEGGETTTTITPPSTETTVQAASRQASLINGALLNELLKRAIAARKSIGSGALLNRLG